MGATGVVFQPELIELTKSISVLDDATITLPEAKRTSTMKALCGTCKNVRRDLRASETRQR